MHKHAGVEGLYLAQSPIFSSTTHIHLPTTPLNIEATTKVSMFQTCKKIFIYGSWFSPTKYLSTLRHCGVKLTMTKLT